MKVFISIPMNGLFEEDIKREFRAISEALPFPKNEVEIIDTWINEEPPTDFHGDTGLWYLAKSIELLAQADIVVMASGWENARGCIIEHECAKEYGIPILDNLKYSIF